MYLPIYFEESRDEELSRIIGAYPLGALVLKGPHGLDANHLPFLFEDDGGPGQKKLLAHVARSNPLWQEASNGDEALVIFRADDAYISPNWYPSKHEFHHQVPTWNYQVVHVHGRLFVHDSERYVRGVVARLTRIHEAQTGEPTPWKMSDASPEYINQSLARIVGIEIEITRIVGKSKLGQDEEERDRRGAAEELAKRGKTGTSDAMLNCE